MCKQSNTQSQKEHEINKTVFAKTVLGQEITAEKMTIGLRGNVGQLSKCKQKKNQKTSFTGLEQKRASVK